MRNLLERIFRTFVSSGRTEFAWGALFYFAAGFIIIAYVLYSFILFNRDLAEKNKGNIEAIESYIDTFFATQERFLRLAGEQILTSFNVENQNVKLQNKTTHEISKIIKYNHISNILKYVDDSDYGDTKYRTGIVWIDVDENVIASSLRGLETNIRISQSRPDTSFIDMCYEQPWKIHLDSQVRKSMFFPDASILIVGMGVVHGEHKPLGRTGIGIRIEELSKSITAQIQEKDMFPKKSFSFIILSKSGEVVSASADNKMLLGKICTFTNEGFPKCFENKNFLNLRHTSLFQSQLTLYCGFLAHEVIGCWFDSIIPTVSIILFFLFIFIIIQFLYRQKFDAMATNFFMVMAKALDGEMVSISNMGLKHSSHAKKIASTILDQIQKIQGAHKREMHKMTVR